MTTLWRLPEGVSVMADGSWRVGGFPILHAASLRHLKANLVFEDDQAFIADGPRRIGVEIRGPAFEVATLRLDRDQGRAFAVLDDGSEETVADGSLFMNAESGRFETTARGGRARAVFSRGAHQTLIDNVEEEGGAFFLRVGERRIPIRT